MYVHLIKSIILFKGFLLIMCRLKKNKAECRLCSALFFKFNNEGSSHHCAFEASRKVIRFRLETGS